MKEGDTLGMPQPSAQLQAKLYKENTTLNNNSGWIISLCQAGRKLNTSNQSPAVDKPEKFAKGFHLPYLFNHFFEKGANHS